MYRFVNSIQSKVLAFVFGLSIEIDRDLISQRTKEMLAKRCSEEVILGRPVGRKSSYVKLFGHEKEIQALLDKKTSKSAICRIFGVNRMPVDSFLKERMRVGETQVDRIMICLPVGLDCLVLFMYSL
jgi:DNA invertase Pin-like site-specific DNA recombinase